MSIHWQSATVKFEGNVIYSKWAASPKEAHNNISKSLNARLRNKSIKERDIVEILIRDASGYFPSCPEIFPGYFHKTLSVAEYLSMK